MAKSKDGVNKSEEVRKLLKADPKIKVKDVVAKLAEQHISVKPNLVYYIKGNIKGRRRRAVKSRKAAAAPMAPSSNGDAVKTILKVKSWAAEVGGLKKLKSLVDALTD